MIFSTACTNTPSSEAKLQEVRARPQQLSKLSPKKPSSMPPMIGLITPEKIQFYPHLKPYQGHWLLSNGNAQLVIAGITITPNEFRYWDMLLATYKLDGHQWLQQNHLPPISVRGKDPLNATKIEQEEDEDVLRLRVHLEGSEGSLHGMVELAKKADIFRFSLESASTAKPVQRALVYTNFNQQIIATEPGIYLQRHSSQTLALMPLGKFEIQNGSQETVLAIDKNPKSPFRLYGLLSATSIGQRLNWQKCLQENPWRHCQEISPTWIASPLPEPAPIHLSKKLVNEAEGSSDENLYFYDYEGESHSLKLRVLSPTPINNINGQWNNYLRNNIGAEIFLFPEFLSHYYPKSQVELSCHDNGASTHELLTLAKAVKPDFVNLHRCKSIHKKWQYKTVFQLLSAEKKLSLSLKGDEVVLY